MKEQECSENKKRKIREKIWDKKRHWFKFKFTLIFLFVGLIFYGFALLFAFLQNVLGHVICCILGFIFCTFFVYPIFEVYLPYYSRHLDDNQK